MLCRAGFPSLDNETRPRDASLGDDGKLAVGPPVSSGILCCPPPLEATMKPKRTVDDPKWAKGVLWDLCIAAQIDHVGGRSARGQKEWREVRTSFLVGRIIYPQWLDL